jgi:hypothetical protein
MSENYDVSTVGQHTKQVLPEHKSQFMLVLLVEFMVLFTIRCVEFENNFAVHVYVV